MKKLLAISIILITILVLTASPAVFVAGEPCFGVSQSVSFDHELDDDRCGHILDPRVYDPENIRGINDFIVYALSHIDGESIPFGSVLPFGGSSVGSDTWEYLYGGIKTPTTQTVLDSFYSSNYTKYMTRAQYDEITADWSRDTYATDCQGLLDAFMTYEEGIPTDINVQMNYDNWCTDKGSIEDIDRDYVLGEALFCFSRRHSRMAHIGWICGWDEDGRPLAVEARGISFGVVITRVDERSWTHRGLMTRVFDYSGAPTVPAGADNPSKVRSCKGSSVSAPVSRAAEPTEIWDGSIAAGFAGGSGTEADPYLISNGAELAYLSAQVRAGRSFSGQFIELTDDIRLNDTSGWESWDMFNAPANTWQPIGCYSTASDLKAFGGCFNGRGHTVYGIYFSHDKKCFHGLFGFVSGAASKPCRIKNVFVSESFLEAVNNVGGIVGYLDGHCEIRGCEFSGRLSAELWCGGIVGFCAASASVRIAGCTNTGSADAISFAGGIAGCIYEHCSITECSNTGCIEAYNDAGGVAGRSSGASVSLSFNDGTVYGTENIAGISGHSAGTAVSRCYNSSGIRAICGAGGITGCSGGAAPIDNCFNTGSISSLECAGGLAGCAESVFITECYNIGQVSGRRSYGGIFGRTASNGTDVLLNVYMLEGCCGSGHGGGEPRTSAELLDRSAYGGFSFPGIWTLWDPADTSDPCPDDPDYPFAELRGLPYASDNIPHLPGDTCTPSPPPDEPADPTETPSAAPVLPGDVDGSGYITVSDAILALRAAMGLVGLDEQASAAADINANGIIEIGDAIIILRTAMGVI